MKILPLLLSVLLPILVAAQVSSRLEIGGGFSIAAYEGDLSSNQTQLTLQTAQLAYALHARCAMSNHLALRLNALMGHLKGDDKVYAKPEWRRLRGFSFSSPLVEVTVVGEYYPWRLYEKRSKRYSSDAFSHASSFNHRRVLPFIMTGLGTMYHKAEVNWNEPGCNTESNPAMILLDKSAKTSGISLVIPLGAGIRFTLSNQITMGVEGTFRFTFSDYLDGVSKAANPNANDCYYTGGVTLSYVLSQH